MNRRRDFGIIISEGNPTRPAFSVRWWEGGRSRRKRGFRTRTEATAYLARIRTALSDGVLQAHRRADVSLASVADEWLRNHSAVRLRSHQHNSERWARLKDMFGDSTPLSDVTPSRILEIRERLQREGRTAATVNRYLALLRTILNYAVTAGYLQVSPVRRFARGSYLLPEPRPRRAPPLATPEEAARLLTVIRDRFPQWFGLFAFLLYTGARRGEAAGLEWKDVDMPRRLVTIRRSYRQPPKSGRARTVPIPAEFAPLLAEHRLRDPWGGELVFPHPHTGEMLSQDARLRDVLDAACTTAGIPRMRGHDLRHGYASLFLMAGGSLTDVQRNLGHSTPVLTSETYGHIAEEHRIREADRCVEFGLGRVRPAGQLAAAGGGAGAGYPDATHGARGGREGQGRKPE